MQRLLRIVSRYLLNASKEGDSTTSLGNLFQCLGIHTVKFLLMYISFCPLPFVLSLGKTQPEPGSILLALSLQILIDFDEVPSLSSLLEADQGQHPQPFLTHEILLNHLCYSKLDPLQRLHVSPVLRSPELHTALAVALASAGPSEGAGAWAPPPVREHRPPDPPPGTQPRSRPTPAPLTTPRALRDSWASQDRARWKKGIQPKYARLTLPSCRVGSDESKSSSRQAQPNLGETWDRGA
ncbi:PREDICTED: uncharacterized protein LOC108449234 [Corvus brachyrhynchos]|uniref:uncharacterized protein LOC108449234 n=1 Tax=Corvus brachyrhynchos TaxID=85066 RepID=UPI00081656B8|nr:PREDICTED: uncharacterized protein LOC108449234 [Corvus brachyrhynchos]